jgi:hypothetical protein
MRAAVVGAGIYGATIAVDLARAGHQVDLYERHRDLLHGATRGNQARLHSGFHYPRSMATALAAKADAARFATRFPGAVNRRNSHYYAIASQGSLTSPDDYLQFCERLDAGARVASVPSLLQGVQACVRVPEAVVNVTAVREQLRRELRHAGVAFHRDTDVDPEALEHDLVVVATYGRGWPAPLRWEVCEVALVNLGARYAFRSFVVLDGPFCSVDPLADRAGHALYHVDATVRAANVGLEPKIPDRLAHLLDRGPVPAPYSNLAGMLDGARRFFRHLDDPAYLGSLFTVRAVLPDVDATDERPTLYHRDGRLLHVLAGKIDGAPTAAERVVAMAGETVAV